MLAFRLTASLALLALSACGGGSTSTTSTRTAVPGESPYGTGDVTDVGVTGGGNGGDAGTPGEDPLAGTYAQPTIYASALSLSDAQNAALLSWRTSAEPLFAVLNTSAPLDTLPTASAYYKGEFLAKKGAGEAYLTGDFAVTVNFDQGTGAGIVDFMEISGADATNRQLVAADALAVKMGFFSGNSFTGTLKGSVQDTPGGAAAAGILPDTYAIDAALEGQFVADRMFGGATNAIAALVDGSITSRVNGAEVLSGIVAAQERSTP